MSVPSSVDGEDVDSPGIGDRDAHTSSPPSQAIYADISSQISTLTLLSARHGEILDRVVDRVENMGTRLDLLWTHKNPDLGIAPVVLTSRTAEMSRLDTDLGLVTMSVPGLQSTHGSGSAPTATNIDSFSQDRSNSPPIGSTLFRGPDVDTLPSEWRPDELGAAAALFSLGASDKEGTTRPNNTCKQGRGSAQNGTDKWGWEQFGANQWVELEMDKGLDRLEISSDGTRNKIGREFERSQNSNEEAPNISRMSMDARLDNQLGRSYLSFADDRTATNFKCSVSGEEEASSTPWESYGDPTHNSRVAATTVQFGLAPENSRSSTTTQNNYPPSSQRSINTHHKFPHSNQTKPTHTLSPYNDTRTAASVPFDRNMGEQSSTHDRNREIWENHQFIGLRENVTSPSPSLFLNKMNLVTSHELRSENKQSPSSINNPRSDNALVTVVTQSAMSVTRQLPVIYTTLADMRCSLDPLKGMSKATVGIDNDPLRANQDSEVVGPSTLAKPVLPDRKLTSEWEQAKHQVQLACQRLHDLELVICQSTASRDSENLIHGSSMDSQRLQTMNHASKMTSLSQTGVNVRGTRLAM